MAKKNILFLQGSAPALLSMKTTAKLHELKNTLDLFPSDYYKFPNVKRWLQRKIFVSNGDIECKTQAYFGAL